MVAMKTILFVLISVVSAFSFANTLNLKDGSCAGQGTLDSGPLLPGIDFTSERHFNKNHIIAKSTVKILGFDNSATANLYFRQTDPANYLVLDLTRPMGAGYAVVGRAACSAVSCTFDATILNGSLYLKETLVATAQGFSIFEGYQKLNGIESRYTVNFTCR